MSIANVYVEPGVYSQFKPSGNLPVIPGGVRVAALVGAGRTTNIVTQEQVTKGTDTLAHTAVSLGAQIVDEDFNTYDSATDYSATPGATISWLTGAVSLTGTIAQPYAGLVGKTFIVTIGSNSPQTYLFKNSIALTITGVQGDGHTLDVTSNAGVVVGDTITAGAASSVVTSVDPGTITLVSTFGFAPGAAVDTADFVVPTAATALEVVTALNKLTGITCTVDSLKVKVATTATSNSSLLIGTGTTNSILGFTDGSYQATPRQPAALKKYFVNYEYAKSSSDYSVRFFFNMSDIVAEHGDVSTTDTLSLGAEILFQHGASAVALVQVNPADGALIQQFRKALDKLLPVDGINIVVPLNPDSGLYSYLSNHVDQASSLTERKERTGIVGLSGAPSISTIQGFATGLANKRMVLVYPPSCTRYVGANTTVSTLDGSFLACACAGIRTSTAYDVADPLTRKELIGFENIPDTLLRAEKNQLASSGVLVIENVGGIFRVRHQKTTDTSTVPNSEYSVVEIVDYTAVNMRKMLETIYIGQKILVDTPSQVKSTVNALLQNLVSREIIVAFTDIQASINSIDPTEIDVQFSISPTYPLNYILVTFSLSTNQ